MNQPSRVGAPTALPRLLVSPAWEDHVAISLIQSDAAALNPTSVQVTPAKTAAPGQSDFAHSLQIADDTPTSAVTKPPSHPVNGPAGQKAANSTLEKNAAATIARKTVPYPLKSLAKVLEMPITIPRNIGSPIATTIVPLTTSAPINGDQQQDAKLIGHHTSEICDTAQALPASEAPASQNQCSLQPALPFDTEPIGALVLDTKPAAISEAAKLTAPSAQSPVSDTPLVGDIDSVLATEAPPAPKQQGAFPTVALITAAESTPNAAPIAQLVMSSHDRNAAAGGIDSLASSALPQESTPWGFNLRATVQPGEIPKTANPSQISKVSLSRSPVTVAQAERMSIADNSLRGFQNSQFNSGSEYPLRVQRSTSTPSDFNPQTPSTNTGSVPGFPQSSSNDPYAAAATTINVLSQVPVTGDQLAANPRLPSLDGFPSRTSTTSSNSPEPSIPIASTVQVARIVETMEQSEMHIGLRTQDFGSVEVHTVVRDMQVGLAVGSEKGDLHTFLISEMPGLQASLRQQDLHFDHIRFLEPGGASTGFSGGDSSQSRSSSQGHSFSPGLPIFVTQQRNSGQIEVTLDGQTGLNVHA